MYNALNPSHEREWDPVNPEILKFLDNGLTLVYVSERLENIALVADVGAFCRPDMILWCIDPGSLTRTEAFEKACLYKSRLRPLKGIYIVASGPWPEK